jgi:hypothetical protein
MLDKLQTPVSVFATFEEEEGYQRALVYNNPVPQMLLLGKQLEIQEASEPTDIIWENRHISPGTRRCKMMLVFLMIFLLLCVSAGIIYFCTNTSNKLKYKYPAADCFQLEKEYIDDKKVNEKRWIDDAMKEYYVNKHYEENDKPTHFQGIMQCFCDHRKKQKDKKNV